MRGWRLVSTVFMGVSVAVLGACCTAGLQETLPINTHPQEMSNWCWAASGQVAMDYLGRNVAQCTQLNDKLRKTDCPCNQCSQAVSRDDCNEPGWPDLAMYGFTFTRTNNQALDWPTLQAEISRSPWCGGTPVLFSWHWVGGNGHMMVAYGYTTIAGVHYVLIYDPDAPCTGDSRWISYAEYVSANDHPDHWDDFYHIRRP